MYASIAVTSPTTVKGVVSASATPNVQANESPTEKSMPMNAGSVKELDPVGSVIVINGMSVPTVGADALL